MGAALACKRGKGKCKEPSRKMARSMTEAQLRDFARKRKERGSGGTHVVVT